MSNDLNVYIETSLTPTSFSVAISFHFFFQNGRFSFSYDLLKYYELQLMLLKYALRKQSEAYQLNFERNQRFSP